MAANQFMFTSMAGWIDGLPNTPVRFEDINVNNIFLVLKKTWINPETNQNIEVFQLEMLEGGGTVVQLKRTTYLFRTMGASLAVFKAWLDNVAAGNNVVTYTDLFAIGNIENVIVARPVLVNDDQVVRRVYTLPSSSYPTGYTTLYTNAGNEWQYLKLYLKGDQETGKDGFYDYYVS